MIQPTIDSLRRHAWQIVDKYGMRLPDNVLHVIMEVLDAQDGSSEAVITIRYKRPSFLMPTAQSENFYRPLEALAEFEKQIAQAAKLEVKMSDALSRYTQIIKR